MGQKLTGGPPHPLPRKTLTALKVGRTGKKNPPRNKWYGRTRLILEVRKKNRQHSQPGRRKTLGGGRRQEVEKAERAGQRKREGGRKNSIISGMQNDSDREPNREEKKTFKKFSTDSMRRKKISSEMREVFFATKYGSTIRNHGYIEAQGPKGKSSKRSSGVGGQRVAKTIPIKKGKKKLFTNKNRSGQGGGKKKNGRAGRCGPRGGSQDFGEKEFQGFGHRRAKECPHPKSGANKFP